MSGPGLYPRVFLAAPSLFGAEGAQKNGQRAFKSALPVNIRDFY